MNRLRTDSLSQNYTGHLRSLSEGSNRTASNADYLVRLGIRSNDSTPSYYRKVILDPKGSLQNASLRPYAAEVLENLLDLVMNDPTMWGRAKTVLSQKKPKSLTRLREDVSGPGFKSLIEKAEKSGEELDVIFEVYSRGREKGSEEEAFARVNSFIAGGRARKLDADLLPEEVKPIQTSAKQLDVVKRVLSTKSRK